MDDMRSAVAESSAMLADVAGLVDAAADEAATGASAPFGVADVAEVTAEAARLARSCARRRWRRASSGRASPRCGRRTRATRRCAPSSSRSSSAPPRTPTPPPRTPSASGARLWPRSAPRARRGAPRASPPWRARGAVGSEGAGRSRRAAAPPALDRMRRVIDEDVRRLTSAMADLEAHRGAGEAEAPRQADGTRRRGERLARRGVCRA